MFQTPHLIVELVLVMITCTTAVILGWITACKVLVNIILVVIVPWTLNKIFRKFTVRGNLYLNCGYYRGCRDLNLSFGLVKFRSFNRIDYINFISDQFTFRSWYQYVVISYTRIENYYTHPMQRSLWRSHIHLYMHFIQFIPPLVNSNKFEFTWP